MTTYVVRTAQGIYSIGHAVAIDKMLFRRFFLTVVGLVAAMAVVGVLSAPLTLAEPGGEHHGTAGAASAHDSVGNGPGGSASGGRRHVPRSPAFRKKQSDSADSAGASAVRSAGGQHNVGRAGGGIKRSTKPARPNQAPRAHPGGVKSSAQASRPVGRTSPAGTPRSSTSSRPHQGARH